MSLKYLLFVCLIIAINFLPARAQSGPESWKLYTVPAQGFSIALPTLPAMSDYPPTEYSRGHIMLGAYADGVVYAIEVYENERQNQSLADFIAEQTGQWKPDAAKQKEISVNGVAGREYSSDWPSKHQFFRTRLWLYRFMVMGTTADDPRAQKFFSSISFSEKPTGIAVSEGPGTPYHAETGDTAFTGKEVEKKVRLGMKPEPMYTEEARRNQVTGTVILKVVFSSGGNVTNIRTVTGLPFGLTERAIAAAKNIKFIPAIKDGHYVSMWMQLEYNFNLY
jgi:TonB family protein